MRKKHSKKFHQEPLRHEWAQPLLAKGGVDLFAELQNAQVALDRAVQACRNHLESSPLTPVVAQAAANEISRGAGTISTIKVESHGEVILEIRSKKAGERRNWKSSLPSIKELRAEAEEMNLDISDLGRSKRKIFEAIQAAKGGEVEPPEPVEDAEPEPPPPSPPKKAKKMFRTGDAVTPTVVNTTGLPFDKSTDLPDDLLDGTKPDLKAVLADSEGLDIDAILDGTRD